MNKLTTILFLILTLLLATAHTAAAQPGGREPEMADLFRSEGKIYVVIAVLAITFLCLAGYLIYIDRRLKKLEDKN